MYFQANEGSFSIYPEAHQKALNQDFSGSFSTNKLNRSFWGHSIAWSSIRALGQPFFSKEKTLYPFGYKATSPQGHGNVLCFQRIANQGVINSRENRIALSAQSAQEINGCKLACDAGSNPAGPIIYKTRNGVLFACFNWMVVD